MKSYRNRVVLNYLLVGFIFLVVGGSARSQGYNYTMDSDYYPIPDMKLPQKGEWFTDPTFHTSIIRVSDKKVDGFAGNKVVMIPEYSRSSPENADGTFLLLTWEEYDLMLYDAKNFNFIKKCKVPGNIEGGNEARWDDEDPNVFYCVREMSFYKYDVQSDKLTLIRDFSKDFPEGWLLHNDGEGEPSWDCNIWAFSVRGQPPKHPNYDKFAILTYDLEKDKIVGKMLESDFPSGQPYSKYTSLNTISVSPYGDRVIVEWDWPSPTVSYKIDFSDPVKLGNDGHSDLAIDADGNEVHVIKDDSYDVFAMLDLKTGKRTNIINLPLCGNWNKEPGHHISGNCYKTPGWVVISTYGGDPTKWPDYQVFMLELKKNGRIWRIAHTHGEYIGTGDDKYWAETKATINHDGTKIWWGSNWGILGNVDTYQATLPETWWEDLTESSRTSAELSMFEASTKDGFIELIWRASSASTNCGYEIERGSNDKNFQKIGFIEAKTVINEWQNYYFLDRTVDQGNHYYYRLKQIKLNGTYEYSDMIEISTTAPDEYYLRQNYPNPFNSSTEIFYSLPKAAVVDLSIYDIFGRHLKTLLVGKQAAGNGVVGWDGIDKFGKEVASGTYFYRFKTQDITICKKLLLIK